MFSLSGAYSPNDPGLLINIYYPVVSFQGLCGLPSAQCTLTFSSLLLIPFPEGRWPDVEQDLTGFQDCKLCRATCRDSFWQLVVMTIVVFLFSPVLDFRRSSFQIQIAVFLP